MHTFAGALAGSRRDVCAAARGTSDTKMSVARGSLTSRALELDVASGASLFASRTGAGRNWNLGLISDMKDRGTNHETLLLIRARPTWQVRPVLCTNGPGKEFCSVFPHKIALCFHWRRVFVWVRARAARGFGKRRAYRARFDGVKSLRFKQNNPRLEKCVQPNQNVDQVK